MHEDDDYRKILVLYDYDIIMILWNGIVENRGHSVNVINFENNRWMKQS